MMKGRPILGVMSGFFFGLFGGMALFLYGVIPLHSSLLWILPLLGILLGLILAAWAPFGARNKPTVDDGTSADDTVVDGTPPVEPNAQ